jgi:hypothetical protein
MDYQEARATERAELRVVATCALTRCCVECVAALRTQLLVEEFRAEP